MCQFVFFEFDLLHLSSTLNPISTDEYNRRHRHRNGNGHLIDNGMLVTAYDNPAVLDESDVGNRVPANDFVSTPINSQ